MCLCVRVSSVVGKLDLSESRSTHGMPHATHSPSDVNSRRGRGGKGPSTLAAGAFCPCHKRAHLIINCPSTLLAAFPCWLWAEMPKITRRVLPLVGHSVVASGQACLLSSAGLTSAVHLCSYFLWPPSASSFSLWRLPFYYFS